VHLPAAGLAGWEIDGMPEALEQAHDCLAGLRKQRVVVTGDEKRNPQNASRSNLDRLSIEIIFPNPILNALE
jgi:hypothetical protein